MSPLVIIDVQNGFVNEKSDSALAGIVALAESWRRRNAPIFLTRFINPPGSQWETLIGWRRLRESPEIDLHPDVARFADAATVVDKYSYTSLAGDFLGHLQIGTYSEVVLCGIATDSCVLKTAVDLFEYRARSIRPIVAKDACGSHAGAQAHESGLFLLTRFIGRDQIVDVADVLAASTAA
jgi:nicotinamidase-related amidase